MANRKINEFPAETVNNTDLHTIADATTGAVSKITHADLLARAETLQNKTISGSANSVTNINASNITSGTLSAARLPTDIPQANITNLVNDLAAKAPLVSGTVPLANLPGVAFPTTDFNVTTPGGVQTVTIKESKIQSIIEADNVANTVVLHDDYFDLDGSSKIILSQTGLLLPRMTKAQRNTISSPQIGLAIFQTDNTPGIRVRNATNWMRFTETTDD